LPLIARRAELAILTGAIEAAECGRGACSAARREETISSRPTRRTETIALGQRAASSESSLTPQGLLRFAVAVLDEAHDESDPASAARVGGGWMRVSPSLIHPNRPRRRRGRPSWASLRRRSPECCRRPPSPQIGRGLTSLRFDRHVATARSPQLAELPSTQSNGRMPLRTKCCGCTETGCFCTARSACNHRAEPRPFRDHLQCEDPRSPQGLQRCTRAQAPRGGDQDRSPACIAPKQSGHADEAECAGITDPMDIV
jgi:hypothetical protein